MNFNGKQRWQIASLLVTYRELGLNLMEHRRLIGVLLMHPDFNPAEGMRDFAELIDNGRKHIPWLEELRDKAAKQFNVSLPPILTCHDKHEFTEKMDAAAQAAAQRMGIGSSFPPSYLWKRFELLSERMAV